MVSRPTVSSGIQGSPGGASGPLRVSATWMASRGFMEETDQSLPPAITAPVAATLPIG